MEPSDSQLEQDKDKVTASEVEGVEGLNEVEVQDDHLEEVVQEGEGEEFKDGDLERKEAQDTDSERYEEFSEELSDGGVPEQESAVSEYVFKKLDDLGPIPEEEEAGAPQSLVKKDAEALPRERKVETDATVPVTDSRQKVKEDRKVPPKRMDEPAVKKRIVITDAEVSVYSLRYWNCKEGNVLFNNTLNTFCLWLYVSEISIDASAFKNMHQHPRHLLMVQWVV